jgi:UDP-N-acetylglucosamine 2-epimerase
MCYAIRDLAERFADDGLHFIYPVHLNPNVQSPVFQILSGLDNLSLMKPVDYLTMVHLMKRAELILTDSGGIQEEAPTFGVPVLVLRETTERPEVVEAGMVQLVGTQRENIFRHASRLLENTEARASWPRGANPYGDGKAAERIVSVLLATA